MKASLNIPIISFPERVDLSALVEGIRESYLSDYDPSSPPAKYKYSASPECEVCIMPFTSKRDKLHIEKTIFIERNKRPGITGYMSVYDSETRQPVAVMDATELTGARTAAKSLLVADLVMKTPPKRALIYGTSTQAIWHARFFKQKYPEIDLRFVARNQSSCENLLRNHPEISSENILLSDDVHDQTQFAPDLIITTTNSQKAVFSEMVAGQTRLIIAVGSSNGKSSEIPENLVLGAEKYVDSRISISGKGEYAMAIEKGLMSEADVTELRDLILSKGAFAATSLVLFVSKGVIVEDLAVIRMLLRGMGHV